MKISKVMAMMKRDKNITIMRKGYPKAPEEEIDEMEVDCAKGPQWITNGKAFYNLDGTALIRSAGQFFTAYDVKEKQKERYMFKFCDIPEFLDSDLHSRWDDGAIEARSCAVTIGTMDRVLKAFQYGNRIMFIDTRFLTPFEGEDGDEAEYEVREDKLGRRFLCVMDGMMFSAAIYPVEFSDHERTNNLYDTLHQCREEIWRQREASRRAKDTQVATEDGQESIFGDEPEESEE